MAEISLIKLDSTLYDIKDSTARSTIKDLTSIIEKTVVIKLYANLWYDTGIDLEVTGTYVVQMSVGELLAASGLDTMYYSGTLTWYAGTPTIEQSDEVALHVMGKNFTNQIYLRTYNKANEKLKLQITPAKDFAGNVKITFKFKKII